MVSQSSVMPQRSRLRQAFDILLNSASLARQRDVLRAAITALTEEGVLSPPRLPPAGRAVIPCSASGARGFSAPAYSPPAGWAICAG